MCPGTISGAEDPEDRLRAERPPGGYGRARDHGTGTSLAVPEPPPSPHIEALVFLLAVLVGGFLLLAFATRPAMELIGQAAQALGLPFAAPSSYPKAEFLKAMRSVPQLYLVVLVSGQLLFLALAVTGAVLLGGGIRMRLGFVRPRGGWRVLGLAVVLEVLTLTLGVAALLTFLPAGYEPPVRQVEFLTMLHGAPTPIWIAILLAMSVLPGVSEESLFRGLIQRRLLEGWKPVAAVLVTGVIFTFLHPPFVRSLALLPGCLWLGYVAWRCGSILPGIVLHAGTNAGVQIFARLAPLDDPSEVWAPTLLERWSAGGVALLSGALAVWLLILLYRWTRVEPLPASS